MKRTRMKNPRSKSNSKRKARAMRAMILSLAAILIAAMLGIFAFADSASAGAQGSASAGSGAGDLPRIVSKNVSYAEKLYLYYAAPVSSFLGGVPEVRIYSEGGAEPSYIINSYSRERIEAIDGGEEEYYVFRGHGVAMRDIGKRIKAVPVSRVDGREVIGEALEYSVAEYFYERLLRNGYVSMSPADEANTKKYYERRALYFSVLDCAEKSQALFGLEDGEEYVTNLLYCHGEEAAQGLISRFYPAEISPSATTAQSIPAEALWAGR